MLPLGQSTGGLPLAVQLVGRYGDESALLRLGSQLEVARPCSGASLPSLPKAYRAPRRHDAQEPGAPDYGRRKA